ncbi:MAG: hypothetical protein JW892_06910 [Anaerolineae bacterium]|nr:hypothetical protein [Anaerolineae bacterium]
MQTKTNHITAPPAKHKIYQTEAVLMPPVDALCRILARILMRAAERSADD